MDTETRRILRGILENTVYRNAGEMPQFEEPVFLFMENIGYHNRSEQERTQITQIVLAAFDNHDHPSRGMMPELEHHIQTMLGALANAIQRSFAHAHNQ